jgi:menaquinol-cytochrome c reductase iron-sulfur subunit
MQESRRRFLGWLTGLIAVFMALLAGVPLIGLLAAPALKRSKQLWVDLGPLKSVGMNEPTAFTFSYQRIDGWLETMVYGTAYAVRRPGEELFVLSNICTHLGCPVRWSDKTRDYLCPCHGGVFDVEGKVVAGPPPRPLARYDYRVVKGTIQIRIEQG